MARTQVVQVYIAVQIFVTIFLKCDANLNCFLCSRVSDVQSCDNIVSCQQFESCYIQRTNTSSGAVYTLGCKSLEQCPSPQSFILVGREIKYNGTADCLDCCQEQGCNKHLCELKDIPRVEVKPTSVSNCSDNSTDCTNLDKFGQICNNVTQAKLICKRHCGLCNLVDGGWSSWGGWTQCSRSCGLGIESRLRTCSNPTPANGGELCAGNSTQQQSCFLRSCPDDGSWSEWGEWGQCSSQCGIGLTKRHRSCDNPPPSLYGRYCIGDPTDYGLCNGSQCGISITSAAPTTLHPTEYCLDTLSDCGTVDRAFGVCSNKEQARSMCKHYCGLCSIVDGVWSQWTEWSNCPVTCDTGIQMRSRNCSNPPPANGGRDCVGDSKETSVCTLSKCSVHGGWSAWTNWFSCSTTCDMGLTHRRRTCDNPRPSYNGNMCFGDPVEYNLCTLGACKVNSDVHLQAVNGSWTLWTSWSPCYSDVFPCEVGLQNRTRNCTNPAPKNGGKYCDGSPIMYKDCDARMACFATVTGSFARVISGRLEVYYNHTWGTVCDDSFEDVDAKVACKMLGYNNGWLILSDNVPDGTNQIWLDDVHCSGAENELLQCQHTPFGTTNCVHSEDVGVRCSL